MSKISDKTDKFLLNYSYLFWGPLFIGTQCITGKPQKLQLYLCLYVSMISVNQLNSILLCMQHISVVCVDSTYHESFEISLLNVEKMTEEILLS